MSKLFVASQSTASKPSQRGFTLVELMVASTLTVILVIILTQLIIQTQTLARDMVLRVALNAEARQIFELAAFGSYRNLDSSGSSDASNLRDYIAGFIGSNQWVEASGTDNSQLKTWHWDNNTSNYNGSLSADQQGHFLRTDFNKLSLRYVGLDNSQAVTQTVSSSGIMAFLCPDNSGNNVNHVNCTGNESTQIGFLFNRNDTSSYPLNLANNPLVEYGATHPASGAYKYFQGDTSGRNLNFRMQLVDPELLLENNLYNYPVSSSVTPKDGHSIFRGIPYQRRESYRTSFYMMVDY